MYLEPDPLLAFQGKRSTFSQREQIQWADTIKKVRELYSSQKFKQCAAICEDSLTKKQAHPLHETFLRFYAAICRESIGQLAHKYSNNRLPLLNQARDHFTAALAALPLPYCTTAFRSYDCPEGSPEVFGISQAASSLYDPMSPSPLPQLTISDELSESDSSKHINEVTSTSDVPDFSKYTFREVGINLSPYENQSDSQVCQEISPEQRKRLSQSLSIGHVVQEALLPKPLLTKKMIHFSPPPAPRALPPIPTRDPVLRKTALQTLLNPTVFEGLVFSPITPRFNQIRDIFDPKSSQTFQNRHLQRYDALLSSFRTQLLQHIASTDTEIAKTMALQIERQKNRTTRLASFWSVKAEDVEARDKKARIEKLRNGGWNVTKRAHGWKGAEHYESVRTKALPDIAC